jgi:hypothetical protein
MAVRVHLWVFLPLLLVGCAGGGMESTKAPRPSRAIAPVNYGPWLLNGCKLSAKAADLWLNTEGHLTWRHELELTLNITPALAQPPQVSLSGVLAPLVQEGRGPRYTLFMPFTPEIAAQLLQPESYLTVAYQPLGSQAIQEVSFPTAPLLEGLGALGGCGG